MKRFTAAGSVLRLRHIHGIRDRCIYTPNYFSLLNRIHAKEKSLIKETSCASDKPVNPGFEWLWQRCNDYILSASHRLDEKL